MKTIRSFALVSLLGTACSDDASSPPETTKPPVNAGAATVDHGHGDERPLGDLTVGTHTFQVVQLGKVEPGKEGMFDLVFPAGKPVPGIVRVWIGTESGVGSMKAKLGKEGDRAMHGHVLVPKPLPDGAKVWIEIEDGSSAARGSLPWQD